MTVRVTIEIDSDRHKGLQDRIWEKFPSIGGILNDSINSRQCQLSFEAQGITPEEIREFFGKEGLMALIE